MREVNGGNKKVEDTKFCHIKVDLLPSTIYRIDGMEIFCQISMTRKGA